jgi:thiamine pyrophosphate-dependent acetolactate synthase large subunit-like protein
VLAVPANLFLAEAPPGDGEPDGALRATEDAAGAIDAEELRRAVELLEGSSRPLLLVGRGGLTPGAHDAFVALADRLGALLGTTLPARSLFAGHPFDAGVVGGFSTDTARSVLQEVDCVAAFGASLNIFTRAHGELIDGARLVQVDRDPGQIGAALAADAGVVGDAVAVARAMLDALGPDGPGDAPLRRPEVRDALAEPTVFADPGAGGPPIDPRRLTTTLDALLPAPRVVVTDGGHFAGFPATALRVAEPGHFRMTADFGSVGMGLGAAMGAAVARPDLRTVLCIGDGGLLMTLGDLSSLARHGLGVTVVVFNDQAYGAERHFLDLEGLAPESASLPDVTFAPIAAALGIPAHDVRTLEELEALAGPLGADDGPLLLDCRIDPTVRAQWLEDLDAHRKRQYAAAPA